MVKQFLDIDLIKELDLDKLPLTEQAAMLESIGDALMTTIIGRVIPMLDTKAQQDFETLLENAEDISKIQEFLSGHIPNLQDVIDEEIATFKTEALEFYKALQ